MALPSSSLQRGSTTAPAVGIRGCVRVSSTSVSGAEKTTQAQGPVTQNFFLASDPLGIDDAREKNDAESELALTR